MGLGRAMIRGFIPALGDIYRVARFRVVEGSGSPDPHFDTDLRGDTSDDRRRTH